MHAARSILVAKMPQINETRYAIKLNLLQEIYGIVHKEEC